MTTRSRLFVTAGLVILVGAGTLALAQAKKEKASGRGMYSSTDVDKMTLLDGTTLLNTHDKGFLVGNEPSNPMDGNCHDCFATWILAADGSVIQRKGHCVGIDRAGDTWTIWFGEGKPGTWGFIGGTGKFKGMVGGGTFDLVHKWSDGRYAITWEGSWEKK